MKIFVTGGTGFIGSHLIDTLLRRDDSEVYALVRDPKNLKWLKGLDIHILPGDLEHVPQLPSDIDFIYHVAGSTKPRKSADYYTVNREGTASFLKALHGQGLQPRRVVVLSSLAAAGPCRDGKKVAEDCHPCPVSPYGESKLEGERAALAYQDRFPVAVVRVGPVFGPRDRDFLDYFRLIRRGFLPVIGSRTREVSFCYVKDLTEALCLCMDRDLASGEILHVADPRPYSYEEFGRTAAEAMGVRPRRIKLPILLVWSAALLAELVGKLTRRPLIFTRQKVNEMRQEAWVADTSRSNRLLGISARSNLREALIETMAWYRDRGWL